MHRRCRGGGAQVQSCTKLQRCVDVCRCADVQMVRGADVQMFKGAEQVHFQDAQEVQERFRRGAEVEEVQLVGVVQE